jgi:hypothetical protein
MLRELILSDFKRHNFRSISLRNLFAIFLDSAYSRIKIYDPFSVDSTLQEKK